MESGAVLRLLLDTVRDKGKRLDAFISASAVGYYGMVTMDKVFTEEDLPARNDFLSRTCKKWEGVAFDFKKELDIRTVALRTAFVVSENSDGIKKMAMPTRIGLGAPLGSGKQIMPWVHIDDLCRMYLMAIEDESMQGAYNTACTRAHDQRDVHAGTGQRNEKRPFFSQGCRRS